MQTNKFSESPFDKPSLTWVTVHKGLLNKEKSSHKFITVI